MKKHLKNKNGQIHPVAVLLLIIIGIVAITSFFSSQSANETPQKVKTATSQQNRNTDKRKTSEIPTLTLYNTATNQQNKVIVKNAISALVQAQEMQSGKKLSQKHLTSEGLAKYYNEQMNCQQSENKLFCIGGYEYIFVGDGNCNTAYECYVIIDANGSKGPNEEWTDPNTPKDRVRISFGIDNGYINIQTPEILSSPSY